MTRLILAAAIVLSALPAFAQAEADWTAQERLEQSRQERREETQRRREESRERREEITRGAARAVGALAA